MTISGIASFVTIQKTFKAKFYMKQQNSEQDQSIDSNHIGYLLWDAGLGWWEFQEEYPKGYCRFREVYIQKPAKKINKERQILRELFEMCFDIPKHIDSNGDEYVRLEEVLTTIREYHGVGKDNE